jgi:hypothetical protein
MQRPFRASCNEFAGTPMEALTDDLHVRQPQSLITDGTARRSITEIVLPKNGGNRRKVSRDKGKKERGE